MAERVILPLADESDDVVMRLSDAESSPLYTLLSRMSRNELLAKGLTEEQAALVECVTHVCY